MNRTIKFRTWDNVDYMSSPFTLQDVLYRRIEFTSDATIMQFTGLQDSKGVDIYEGDIFLWGEATGRIIFEDGCFVFKTINGNYSMTMRDHRSDEFEIIGNTYENPELLTPSKDLVK